MNLLAAIPGILLPAAIGWLTVGLIAHRAVLTKMEHASWSLILGPTLSMLVVFLLAGAGLTNFSLAGFLVPLILLLLILGGLAWKRRCLLPAYTVPAPFTLPTGWVRYAVIIFGLWTALKLLAGAYDLASVPTYWDDSFNNWNMRGKIFYEMQLPVLEIPVGNGVVQTAQGVSSYPPSLPLFKTWLSVIRGSWQEPLVNGVHLVWLAGLLLTFYVTLRRRYDALTALFGTCLLVSLPLVLIQSMNPYAEIFVASHLLLTVTALFHAAEAEEEGHAGAWMRLSGLSLGLLLFTKNEATVLYAPILLALAALTLTTLRRRGIDVRKTAIAALALFALLALPWIAFKWMNGLTFGNAKAVSGVALGFSGKALFAIWHHLSHEPNEMLLPLALPLALLASGRKALRMPEAVLTLFVIGAVGLQLLLFLFVGALETEAVMQTGLSRGLVQVSPVALLLLILLVERMRRAE